MRISSLVELKTKGNSQIQYKASIKRSCFQAAIFASLNIFSGINGTGCVVMPTQQGIVEPTKYQHQSTTMSQQTPESHETVDSLVTIIGMKIYKNQLDALNKLVSDNKLDLQEILSKTKVKDGDVVGLDLHGYQVKNISALAKLTNLQELDLSRTDFITKGGWVSDIGDLIGLTNLRRLNLSGNYGIDNIDGIANLTNLQELNLDNTNIGNKGLFTAFATAQLPNLKKLTLIKTGISNISALANLVSLEVLDLSNTLVRDISILAGFPNLQLLYLFGTDVSDINALSGLTNLRKLSLVGTQVNDISTLARLINLQEINLSITPTSDISVLIKLTNLQVVNLFFRQNVITKKQDEIISKLGKKSTPVNVNVSLP